MIHGHSFPRPEHLVKIAELPGVDVKELLVSPKSKDVSDQAEAIKEVSRIVSEVSIS